LAKIKKCLVLREAGVGVEPTYVDLQSNRTACSVIYVMLNPFLQSC